MFLLKNNGILIRKLVFINFSSFSSFVTKTSVRQKLRVRQRHLRRQNNCFFCLNFEKNCSVLVLGQFSSDFDDFYIKTFRRSSLNDRVLSFKSLSGHFQDENAADSFVRTFDWKFRVTKVVLKAQFYCHLFLHEKSFLKHGLPSL